MKHYQIFVYDTTVGNRIPQAGDLSMSSPFTQLRAMCSLKSFKDHFNDTIQSTVILADADYAEKIRKRQSDPRWRVQVICLDAESLTPPEPAKWVVEGEPRSRKGTRDNSAAQDIKLDVEPDINVSAYAFDPACGPDQTAWMYTIDPRPRRSHWSNRSFTEMYESVRRDRTPIELAAGAELDALGAKYKVFRRPTETDVTYRKRVLNKFYGL